ncbi:MAG: hypothetical protein D6800_07580, partial [Candidatus Zixiibacteriota bacterium]
MHLSYLTKSVVRLGLTVIVTTATALASDSLPRTSQLPISGKHQFGNHRIRDFLRGRRDRANEISLGENSFSDSCFQYVGSALWSGISDIEVAGNYAYCAMDAGLLILDIANPANPQVVSRVFVDGGFGAGVEIAGNHAYLADFDEGLKVIDISNPAAPTLVATAPTFSSAYDVEISGNYAYVVEGDYGYE